MKVRALYASDTEALRPGACSRFVIPEKVCLTHCRTSPTTLRFVRRSRPHGSRGKIVSAVCHGPAAFVGPKIDGKPLVDGKGGMCCA